MAEPSAGYLSIPVTVTSASQGVFNEAGLDIDFRVESDTNEHGLFLEGSNGYVGIGESAPLAPLHITTGTVNPLVAGTSNELVVEGNPYSGITIAAPETGGISTINFANENDADNGFIAHFHDDLYMSLSMGVNGTGYQHIYTGSTVINETGADHDFRVESDVSTHALFVQGSDGRVGIGTGGPGGTLHLRTSDGAANVTTGLKLDLPATATDGYSQLILQGRGSSTDYNSTIAASYGNGLLFNTPSGRRFSLKVNDTDYLKVNEAETVVNEDSNDHDFRVESDTNTHALFVRGSDGKVGIGTSNPNTTLSLVNSSSLSNVATNLSLTLPATATDGYSFITLQGRSGGTDYNSKIQAGYNVGLSYTSPLKHIFSDGTNWTFVTKTAETVVNEDGIDHDFRVESDTNTHALFVRGSDGKVGINNSSPLYDLHVTDGDGGAVSAASIGLTLDPAASDGYSRIAFKSRHNNADTEAIINTDYLSGLTYNSPDKHFFKHNSVEILTIHSNQVVVNEPGNDVNFRVESDTNTHALFVQGSDGYVGINESSPAGVLHISNPSTPGSASSYPVNGDELIIEGANNAGMTIIGGDLAGARMYLGGNSRPDAASVSWVGSTGQLEIRADTGTDFNTQISIKQGVQVGAPTGGFKGTGTLNAVAVYDDDTLLTDFVLDQAVDGEIDYEFYDSLELGGKAAREWDPRNLDIDWYESQWRERRSLPAFMAKEERFDADGNEIRDSIGKLVQGLQQELETAHVHIAQLNKRLKELEAKL